MKMQYGRRKFKNKKLTLQQWADKTGILRNTIWMRIFRYNWSIEKALKIK